jgi:plasmid stability protein
MAKKQKSAGGDAAANARPALRPGRQSDQFPLRLPDGMRERLKEEAAKHGRSMNAEINDRLELSFRLWDVAEGQNQTITSQRALIEDMKEMLDFQYLVFEEQSDALKLVMKRALKSHSDTQTLATAVENFARGAPDMLNGYLALARKGPLLKELSSPDEVAAENQRSVTKNDKVD